MIANYFLNSLWSPQGKGATSDEEFSARGKFLTTTCHVNKPLSGELTVEVRPHLGQDPKVHQGAWAALDKCADTVGCVRADDGRVGD